MAQAKAHDPVRRRKISEAQKGWKRPRHVIEAMRKGRTGKLQPPHVGAAAGHVPYGRAWTPTEDELVRTFSASEVARLTGRSMLSVYNRRVRLQVPDGRAANGRRPR